MKNKTIKAAVIVSHPDDETIWAGGTILMNPQCEWTIVSLCRGSDPDRAPRFRQAVSDLGARGFIGDLDDSPDQKAISETGFEKAILEMLPAKDYHLIMTHSPFGEYTRHLRHEQTGETVIRLWQNRHIKSGTLWLFAYADSGKGGTDDLPQPIARAHLTTRLPDHIWEHKYGIITRVYGFQPKSYESKICQQEEAFWVFDSFAELQKWIRIERSRNDESACTV